MIDHFDCSDCVEVVKPDLTAIFDVDDALLAVLGIDAGLCVFLKPVIQPSTIDMNACRSENVKTPGCCAMRTGGGAIREVRVSAKTSHVLERFWSLRVRQIIRTFRLYLEHALARRLSTLFEPTYHRHDDVGRFMYHVLIKDGMFRGCSIKPDRPYTTLYQNSYKKRLAAGKADCAS